MLSCKVSIYCVHFGHILGIYGNLEFPLSMVYMTLQKDNKLQKGVKIHQLVILVQYTRLFSDILPSVETPGFSSPVLCVCLWRWCDGFPPLTEPPGKLSLVTLCPCQWSVSIEEKKEYSTILSYFKIISFQSATFIFNFFFF